MLIHLFLCFLLDADLGSPLKSTAAFDSYKELLELKEVNVQILTEKTKVENELFEVKEENSQLEKKIVRKNERIGTLRYSTLVPPRNSYSIYIKDWNGVLVIS